jgi:YegS/Rv2252/BmrU family lipid kinase
MNSSYPTYVLINPASRSGYSLKVWHDIAPLFNEAGISCKLLYSESEFGMGKLAHELTASPDPLNLIVLGGDGSLNEVLNGIQDFSKVFLGFIPTGSSNDFGRALGQASPAEAANQILSGGFAPLDLGEMVCREEESGQELHRFFIVSSGLGFDAMICYGADHTPMKKILNRLHLGKLIYILVALKEILTAKPTEFELVLDQKEKLRFKRCLFTVCMNHKYEGGGFMFCPKAKGADGLLDVCVISDLSKLLFLIMFSSAYQGSHVKYRFVTTRQAKQLLIRSKEALYFHTDGEVPGKSHELEIQIHPGLLNLLNLDCSSHN